MKTQSYTGTNIHQGDAGLMMRHPIIGFTVIDFGKDTELSLTR